MFEEERKRRWLEEIERYAPRRPMTQLAAEFRVTPTNPEPPLVHFGVPVSAAILFSYAKKHGLTAYFPLCPSAVSPVTLFAATRRLSEEVEYTLNVGWPFEYTADCDLFLGLYSNYTMEAKRLVEEDEEDVIQMVRDALGLEAAVRPKWYFDVHDPWEPDD